MPRKHKETEEERQEREAIQEEALNEEFPEFEEYLDDMFDNMDDEDFYSKK